MKTKASEVTPEEVRRLEKRFFNRGVRDCINARIPRYVEVEMYCLGWCSAIDKIDMAEVGL